MSESHVSSQRVTLSTVPTPALVIDGPTVDRNLRRMEDYCKQHTLQLRPHTKTHKTLFIARKQLSSPLCNGLTVAKAGEAEVMREVCSSIMVAYPTVDAARTELLAKLAHDCELLIAIDSSYAAQAISDAAASAGSTIGLLVDLDVGFHRTGLQSVPDAIELARRIDRLPGVNLRGLFIYPGHVTGSSPDQERAITEVAALVQQTIDAWQAAGLNLQILSGGTTPSAYLSHHIPGLTEIRPGTYVFNDMNIVRGNYASLDDCAASVVCTVISTAVPGKVVLDGGSKALTSDRCGPAPESGHGYIVEYPQANIGRLTEEHAEVDVSRCAVRPSVGERVTIIPNHICPCVNLQNYFWWREDSTSEELMPIPVDARGKLS